jgi:hypothetical protein
MVHRPGDLESSLSCVISGKWLSVSGPLTPVLDVPNYEGLTEREEKNEKRTRCSFVLIVYWGNDIHSDQCTLQGPKSGKRTVPVKILRLGLK